MANPVPWEQAGRILTPTQQQNNFHHDFEQQHQQHQHQLQLQQLQLQLQPHQQQHQHVQIQSKGRTTLPKAPAKPAQASKSSKSSPPLDVPSFTFIDHDDDLASKRIKDTNARKAIRSHVMRDVRRRERLAGLKRTSKRGAAKEKPLSPATGKKMPVLPRVPLPKAGGKALPALVRRVRNEMMLTIIAFRIGRR
ncbi:hypothetical protein ACJ72_06198 [Emergomyces africanus]|uniref:Uncharacterized protein n=1 Tax=Emergomyces africanus TaxID=1955775 RepID=A0A1B7NRR3_9EURO|nr:hypothetical protein ACJ72_06198 [Emergomyces africanus]